MLFGFCEKGIRNYAHILTNACQKTSYQYSIKVNKTDFKGDFLNQVPYN